MKSVLVTGANGFIGRVLVQRLLTAGVDRIVALDLSSGGMPNDLRIVPITGSIAEAALLDGALESPVDAVFHLASVPGGAAEKDPVLGRRVNLDATVHLLERLSRQTTPARFVFASTIAVYGEAMPALVDEQTPAAPVLSYGAHKLACEILVADAARRGQIRGCSLRLPGVVARPGDGAGLISAFMSQLFWKLRDGLPIVLPVERTGTAWWISVSACVDNLLHAARVDDEATGPRRVVQMPALHLTMDAVVAALARECGEDRIDLASYEPNDMVQRLFASYPPLLTPKADALGFRHDGSADALVRQVLKT